MAPYQKRYKKKNYGKYKYKKYLTLDKASKALAVAYSIKKLMNVEFKFHDVQLMAQAITNTPIITQLTNIPQGDTDTSRDGAQVKLTRHLLRYTISSNALATDGHIVRCMIIHDKQTNGAIYSDSDLLQDVSNLNNLTSPLNLDNKYRFRVLYDKVHTLVTTASNGQIYKAYINDMDLRLRFESSTPSIADLNSSSLSFIMMASNPNNSPSITLFSRVRYVDN